MRDPLTCLRRATRFAMKFAMRLKGLDRLMRRLARVEADRRAAGEAASPPVRPATGGAPIARSGPAGSPPRSREDGR